MLKALRATLLPMLALAGLAALAAVLSNALATPSRRMSWLGSVPGLAPVTVAIEKPLSTAPPPRQPSQPEGKATPQARPTPTTEPIPHLPAPDLPSSSQDPAASTPIREITSQEAWLAFQSGAPFLDARRGAEFKEGHVAGAWSTPVWESDLDDRLIMFKAKRRPGSEDAIVIYCSGGDCRDSHLLASRLLNDGYFHLLIYRDGFPDWVAKGHPIEKGEP